MRDILTSGKWFFFKAINELGQTNCHRLPPLPAGTKNIVRQVNPGVSPLGTAFEEVATFRNYAKKLQSTFTTSIKIDHRYIFYSSGPCSRIVRNIQLIILDFSGIYLSFPQCPKKTINE